MFCDSSRWECFRCRLYVWPCGRNLILCLLSHPHPLGSEERGAEREREGSAGGGTSERGEGEGCPGGGRQLGLSLAWFCAVLTVVQRPLGLLGLPVPGLPDKHPDPVVPSLQVGRTGFWKSANSTCAQCAPATNISPSHRTTHAHIRHVFVPPTPRLCASRSTELA